MQTFMNKLYRFDVFSLYDTRYYYLKVTFYKKSFEKNNTN